MMMITKPSWSNMFLLSLALYLLLLSSSATATPSQSTTKVGNAFSPHNSGIEMQALSDTTTKLARGGGRKNDVAGAAPISVHPGYKFLIWYTVVGATGFGMSMFFPDTLLAVVHKEWAGHVKSYDVWYRCLGALWLSLAGGSLLALGDPIKFSPVYVCQLLYKSIWILTTSIPRFLQGNLSDIDGLCALLMLTFIVMDVLFLPWDYLLPRHVPPRK